MATLKSLAVAALVIANAAIGVAQAPRIAAPERRPLPTSLVTQLGHLGRVTGAEFSADGRLLLTVSNDNTACLWEVATGAEVRQYTDESGVVAAAFLPDNTRALIVTGNGVLQVWDLTKDHETARVETHVETIRAALAPNGHEVLAASTGRVVIWDLATATRVTEFKTLDLVDDLAWSPNSRSFAIASRVDHYKDNGLAQVYDRASGEVRTLSGQTNRVFSVSFAPDGSRVVTASFDHMTTDLPARGGAAHIWDAASGRELMTLKGPLPMYRVRFSPGGLLIATGDSSGVRFWDAASGAERRLYKTKGVDTLAFAPDGRSFVTGENLNVVRVWDVASGSEVRRLEAGADNVIMAAISTDGTAILTSPGNASISVWDVENGGEQHRFGHKDTPYPNASVVAIAPDGRSVAASFDGKAVDLWDPATAKAITRLAAPSDSSIFRLAFTPDGRRLVSAASDGVRVWDIATSRVVQQFSGDGLRGLSQALAIAPDGTWAATAGSDYAVHVLDLATGQEKRAFPGDCFAIAISPDGTLIALATIGVALGADGDRAAVPLVKIRRIADGRNVATLSTLKISSALAFSPDGHLLAVSAWLDPVAHVFDAATGIERYRLEGHFDGVNSIAFSPDGKALVTAGRDGTSRVWNASTGAELARLISFRNGAWAVVDSGGRFDASNGGAVQGLHWTQGLNVIALEQLKERFYDPGLLAKVLGVRKEPLRDVRAFDRIALFPTVVVQPPDAAGNVRITLTDQGGGVGRVAVWLNAKEITADARGSQRTVPANGRLDLTVSVAGNPLLIPGKPNEIEVRAYNGEEYLSSRGLKVPFNAAGNANTRPPKFFAVVAGVSDYEGTEIDLRFAAKDAADFARAVRIGGQRLFGDAGARVDLFTTETVQDGKPPTKENIVTALTTLAKDVHPQDVVLVYLAGHGVNYGGAEGDFYYLTRQARNADLKDPAVRNAVGLSSEELTTLLRKIPALKQVLILDTCGAGRAVERLAGFREVPSSQVRALERMKDRTGLFVLAGAAADAVSYETSRYGQGLLTYSLLTGMRGAALREDQFVDVSKLFDYAVDSVPQLAAGIGGVQQPLKAVPVASASFDIGQIGAEQKLRIPVAASLPMVLRATFQDESRLVDHLGLGGRVNGELRQTAARGATAPLVFVDAPDLPGAYTISGLYRVTGTNVVATVGVFLGSQEIGRFAENGTSADLDGLATRVVSRTEELLSRR